MTKFRLMAEEREIKVQEQRSFVLSLCIVVACLFVMNLLLV